MRQTVYNCSNLIEAQDDPKRIPLPQQQEGDGTSTEPQNAATKQQQQENQITLQLDEVQDDSKQNLLPQ